MAPNPWTIVAAGGATDAGFADMYTDIEAMIGVSVTAMGGGAGGIATGTDNRGSLAGTQRC